MMDRPINAQTSTTDSGAGGQEPREAGALSSPASTFEFSTVILEEMCGSALEKCPLLKSQLAIDFSLSAGDKPPEVIE